MENIKEYIPKEWNNFDIPTPEDMQNIENGIKNNNHDIIGLNDKLYDYETKVNGQYEAYKEEIEANLGVEKGKLENVIKKCDVAFTNFNTYKSYVDTMKKNISDAKATASSAEEKINSYISNLIKHQYSSTQTYSSTINYTKDGNSDIFMDWAQTGYLSYKRCGNEFSLAFNVRGAMPQINGNIVLLKLPNYITPAENLELNMTTYIGGAKRKIVLRPDGYVVLMGATVNDRYTSVAIANYNSVKSIWRYDGLDLLYILKMS